MAVVDIPFNVGSAGSDDSVFLSGSDGCIYNGFVDLNGRVHKMPGYEEVYDLGTGKYSNGLFAYRNEINIYNYNYQEWKNRTTYVSASSGYLNEPENTDVVWVFSNGREFAGMYRNGKFTFVERARLSNHYSYPNYVSTFDAPNKNNVITFARTKGDVEGAGSFSTYQNADLVFAADGAGTPIYLSPWQFTVDAPFAGADLYGRSLRDDDPEAPGPCSHIIAIDTYLLGNNIGLQTFDISYPNSPFVWDGDFATASYRADTILAVHEARHKVLIFGANSVEIWKNDGTTPFSPESNHIKSGTFTPYSIQNCDGVMYWLDNFHRIVACDISETLTPQEVSPYLTKLINKQGYKEDCLSGYMISDTDRFYIADFATANNTVCINTLNGSWSKLGKWDTTRGKYTQYGMLNYQYLPGYGCIASGRNDGKLYRIDKNIRTYGGDEIRLMIRTPIINHDTTDDKKTEKIQVYLQRTQDVSAEDIEITPVLMIRWRDNGSTQYCPWRRHTLTDLGKTSHTVEIFNCGSYVDRQYEIVLLGDYPVCITTMKEFVS